MGIDVFNGDGHINWPEVKASGHSFGICKATQGIGETDARFNANLSGLKAAGMIRGAYHYFTSADPAAQAQRVLSVLQSNGYDYKTDLPPAIDVEDGSLTRLGRAQLRSNIAAFLHPVQAAAGRLCLFYVSPAFANEHLDNGFSGHPLWLAEYNSHDQPTLPQAWSAWKIWQYNDVGTVPGAGKGTVDVNRYNGDLADLQAWIASGK